MSNYNYSGDIGPWATIGVFIFLWLMWLIICVGIPITLVCLIIKWIF